MFGRQFWTTTSLYAVLATTSAPLALRLVPPNRWYGFRLPGLRADPATWYDVNALGGTQFLVAMAVCAGINTLICWKGTDRMHRMLPWINGGLIALSFWTVSLQVLEWA